MFAACDVLVFPATKPHFARPIIEASAMGKPVVASNLSAINELIVEGQTGYLVDHTNPEALANRIVTLFRNEVLSKQMGDNGVVFAMKNFGYEGQMKKIVDVYNWLEYAK